MDIFGFILLILVLFLLGGAGYFAYDYLQHKKDLDAKLKETTTKIEGNASKIETEGNTRMSNLKYMVGEINKVHDDIFTTLETRVDEQKTALTGVASDQTKLISGMGTLFKVEPSPLSSVASSNAMSILDLPGNPNVNVQLLKHVTTVSGLTARDLKSEDGVLTSVKLCGAGDDPRCIQFPDENGNTYLTSLADGKSVVIDGVSEFTNKLVLKGTAIVESPDAPIQLNAEQGVYMSDMITSAGYIIGDGSRDLLTVGTIRSADDTQLAEALRIDATGKLVLPDNNTIQVENSKLIMNAPNGMEVRGKYLNVIGDAFVNGKEVAVLRYSTKTPA